MINSFFNYSVESSVCLFLFVAVYRLLISKLTYFSWIRIYLILSVILSLSLPMLTIPVQWNSSLQNLMLYWNPTFVRGSQADAVAGNGTLFTDVQQNGSMDMRVTIIYVLIFVYFIGLLYKSYYFARNLNNIRKCIKRNPIKREGNYWLVNLMDQITPFSFFNYIFLTDNLPGITNKDLQRIKEHEIIHAKQYHSLDVILIEFVSIIFWFNPMMAYLKKSIKEIHEYIVDEKIAGSGEMKRDYAQLLLTLASDSKVFNLSASFTGQQIRQRILMIGKPRSSPGNKLTFVVLIPLTALLLLSFSYIKNPITNETVIHHNEINLSNQLVIGEIIWKGSTVFSIETLNKAFGLKKGDKYNHEDVNNRLWNGNLPLLYLDNGYVFYKSDLSETQNNGKVDLTISIYEGIRAKIGEIILKGNVKVPSNDILKQIVIQPGDLFNKTKIINSVRAIAAMGKFDPAKINPTPIPNSEKSNDEYAVVDLLFEITEIINK